jgi:hypothetical protein
MNNLSAAKKELYAGIGTMRIIVQGIYFFIALQFIDVIDPSKNDADSWIGNTYVLYIFYILALLALYFLIRWTFMRFFGKPYLSMNEKGLSVACLGMSGKTIPWSCVRSVQKKEEFLFSTLFSSSFWVIFLSYFFKYSSYVIAIDKQKCESAGLSVRQDEVELAPIGLTASLDELEVAFSSWLPASVLRFEIEAD